jgi:hypothetical protein
MSKEQGLQFKPFVPRLVEALEDADGGVREVAKVTVVELFRCVSTLLFFGSCLLLYLTFPAGVLQAMRRWI